MIQGSNVPGARQQRGTHVGDRQLSELWSEVCRLRASETALKEENMRLQQMILALSERCEGLVQCLSRAAAKCWRRERRVGKECNGQTEKTTE